MSAAQDNCKLCGQFFYCDEYPIVCDACQRKIVTKMTGLNVYDIEKLKANEDILILKNHELTSKLYKLRRSKK